MRILPSLKEKKRYVAIEVLEGNFNQTNFIKIFKEIFGEISFSKASIRFLNLQNLILIKCNNKFVPHVLTTILFLNDCIVNIFKISGTIASIQRKIENTN